MDHHSACLLLLTCLTGFSVSETEEGGAMGETAYGPSSVEIHGVYVVTVGIPFGFQCTADCYPGCTFSWSWGNVTSPGPELSLQLMHIEPMQILNCTVNNPTTGETAMAHRTLLVTSGPSNVRISGPTFLTVGAVSNFTCSAKCYPSCSYSWTVAWEGETLTTTKGDTISVTPAASTVLSESLICMATDTVSNLYISTTASLPVASITDISIAGDRTVTMGKHYEFTCYAECEPSCSIAWKYMGKTFYGDQIQINVLHQGDKKKFACHLQITFSDYSKTEPLTCEATNSASRAVSNTTIELTVIDPFSVRPTSQAQPAAHVAFSLRCVGSQNPASVTWLKNKHPMVASDRVHFTPDNITMTFSPLLQEDDGMYQCVVAEGGTPMQSVGYEMKVNYGPSSVEISGVTAMTVGMPYEFVCSVSCYPPCRFTWTWDGKSSSGPKLSLQPGRLLPPQNLVCTAVNPATGKTFIDEKRLEVIAGPTNIRISGPAFLTAGEASNFTCSADCHPSCSYLWTVSYEWETFATLRGNTISVTPAAGVVSETLVCRAQDPVSHLFIERAFKLQVARLSNITIAGDRAVAMGKRYTYTCSAVCTPSCVFTWRFRGKTFEKDRLTITVSDYAKVEPLTCEARNTDSNVTIAATMNLTVIDPFSVRPTSQALPLAGKPFSLKCVGPRDPTSITWLKNKRQIPPSKRVHFSPDNTSITLSPLLREDGGLYQCLVVEGFNRTVHDAALVVEGGTPILSVGYLMQVNFGPDEVLIVNTDGGPVGEVMFAQPGSTKELRCVTDCFPVCLINWFYNGTSISTNASISFTPVTPPYAATLICVAFNSATGKNGSALTTLVVPDGPRNVIISGPDTLEIGVTATFRCSAECSPSCSFKWTLYGKTMPGSEVDITVNRHVSTESISCQAENTFTGKMATANETLAVSDPVWCGC